MAQEGHSQQASRKAKLGTQPGLGLQVVEHLASLAGSDGSQLLSVCTFDNRGIGGSTSPKEKRRYSTLAMAHDTLALLDYLGWSKVHIVGLSLGGVPSSLLDVVCCCQSRQYQA